MLPENDPERKLILKALGAELTRTSPLESTDGAIREAAPVLLNPDRYFCGSTNNPANWQAHYTHGAGDHRTDSGWLTAVVYGPAARSSGRFTSEKYSPSIKLMFRDSPFHGLEGLKHMESAIVPGIYDPTLADEDLRIDTERSYQMVRRLAREEGLLAGISSGAAVAAMLDVARRLDSGVIVTVFPDGAEKYLNEKFWTVDE